MVVALILLVSSIGSAQDIRPAAATSSSTETRKDFEVPKEDISRIDLRKPSFWRREHIIITMATDEPVKIIIAHKSGFWQVQSLMQTLRPPGVVHFL